jgi:hypothetical protein
VRREGPAPTTSLPLLRATDSLDRALRPVPTRLSVAEAG